MVVRDSVGAGVGVGSVSDATMVKDAVLFSTVGMYVRD